MVKSWADKVLSSNFYDSRVDGDDKELRGSALQRDLLDNKVALLETYSYCVWGSKSTGS